MTNFSEQAHRLIEWCKNDALPFWAKNGVDPDGGFYEDLALDGSPNTLSLRRVQVQARQCYVYSHAANMGWYPKAQTVSDHGWHYLTTKGFQSNRLSSEQSFYGCAHLLKPSGNLHDGLRDTYAQAFLVLAATWRLRAFDDQTAKACLYDTVNFLNTDLKAFNAGWIENDRADLPRRQNPHMHLFEAFLAAYETTSDTLFIEMAKNIYDLFTQSFFDQQTGTLLEFFDADWNSDPATGHLTEPGHMMEWSWLLNWYGRLTGTEVNHYAERLYKVGVEIGTNLKTGLLCNETDLTGSVTRPDSRLWCQTEYIKANIARARNGQADAAQLAGNMIDLIFKNYLDVPVKGGWHDERDADGKLKSCNMPSSTFYHIFCAAAEVSLLHCQE